MIDRCTNPKATGYEYYGGKGVTVCERWRTFELFKADMGEPKPNESIDRIDSSKGYEPGNCRWATKSRQARNKTKTKMFEHDGRKMPLMDWCDEMKVEYKPVYDRMRRGWTFAQALGFEARVK